MLQHADITENIEITSGSATLSGTLYHPQAAPKAAVLLHGATAVPQRFYRHFAAWLASEGYACLTYDYQDFGASATGKPKHAKATMVDWGLHDQSAAQAALAARLPNVPLWVIGHSLGGFMVPFHKNASQIDRLITVASGTAYVSDHPWPYRAVATLFWHILGPVGIALLGYLPGRRLGIGHDLPAGVFWQWRRWCTSKTFYAADIGTCLPAFTKPAFTGPFKLIAISDDEMVPPKSVWKIMKYFPEAMKRQKVLRPEEFGLKRIGHIEAFSRKNAVLWPEIIK